MLNKIKNQKGVSLFLALVIMTIFLAMGLGLTAISLSQKKVIRGIDYSISALGAADTGVEEILYLDRKCIDDGPDDCDLGVCKIGCSGVKSGYNLPGNLSNGARYDVTFSRNCGLITIKSTGSYKEVKRAFEINFGYSLVGSYLNSASNRDCNYICDLMDCGCGQVYLVDVVTGVSEYWYWFPGLPGGCATNTAADCSMVMRPDPIGSPESCPGVGDPWAMWTYCDCIEK